MDRDPGKMHPVALPIIAVGYIATAIWVLWTTVVAFVGGTIPLFGWKVEGGILWGLLWIGIGWPLVFGLTFLLFRLFDAGLWWLNDKLSRLFRDK